MFAITTCIFSIVTGCCLSNWLEGDLSPQMVVGTAFNLYKGELTTGKQMTYQVYLQYIQMIQDEIQHVKTQITEAQQAQARLVGNQQLHAQYEEQIKKYQLQQAECE